MKKFIKAFGLSLVILLGGMATAQAAPFLATFRTTSPNESITLPLPQQQGATGPFITTYNFTVDWGDGSPTSDITAYDDADRIHTYATAGDHQISVTGTMPTWDFRFEPSSKDKIISIDDAGDVGFGVGITNMYQLFQGTSNLTSIALFDTSSATNMEGLFKDSGIATVPLFNTSSATSMRQMFFGTNVTTVPLFDTSSVENMGEMFRNTTSLTTVPLFDTSLVTNMSAMFLGSSLTSVPLFDTSLVTNMSAMFNGTTSLTTVPLLNTSAVENMASMFGNSTGITTLPLFDTSSVTNMSYMFYGANAISEIPLFDSSSVTNFSEMFTGATSVTQGSLSGTQYSISYADTALNDTQLRDVFAKLGTAAGVQTITIPATHGLDAADYSVAEGKGWTVLPSLPGTSCTTYSTTFFDTFNFYGSSSALTALGTYVYQYFYYDCESKSFQYGNESSALTTAPDTSSKQGTTTEIATINTNKTAEEGKNYYDTELGTFKTGASDGSLVTLTAPTGKILDATGIAAVSDADEGDFYFNTTTGEFYIGQTNGSLAVLFTTN